MSRYFRHFLPGLAASLLLSLATAPASAQGIPAFLPTLDKVPASRPMPIDGIWTVDTLGKKIRIQSGRAFALEGWLHLFVLRIDPEMVVIRNITQTAAGYYSGDDLPLAGAWQASVQQDRSISVAVAGALGPANYRLLPVRLDNPLAYTREMEEAGLIAAPPPALANPIDDPQPLVVSGLRAQGGAGTHNTTSDGFCTDKGGEGQYLCTKTLATDHGPAYFGCGGRNLYLSDGACYSCAEGYKRASLTRKMDHPQACQQRGFNKQVYQPASYERRAFGCADGQFKHKQRCKSCPAETSRIHVAGLDSGKCRVPQEYHCNEGLEPSRLKPDNLITRAGNFVSAKVRKRCAPPFDLSAFANNAIAESPAGPVVASMGVLGARLLFGDEETKRKAAELKQNLKDRDLAAAWQTLTSFDEFGGLIQAADDAGDFSISISASVDGSLWAGYAQEHGLAIDLVDNKLKGYSATAFTKGVSGGYDAGFSIGIWDGAFTTDYAQGVIVETHISGGAGVGVWATYYNPGAAAAYREPYFVGFTVSSGWGFGAEFGEYNEVYTKVISSCDISDIDTTKLGATIDIGRLLLGQDC